MNEKEKMMIFEVKEWGKDKKWKGKRKEEEEKFGMQQTDC